MNWSVIDDWTVKNTTAGKELFACQSAVKDFNDILKTVGGEKERERARYVVLDIQSWSHFSWMICSRETVQYM